MRLLEEADMTEMVPYNSGVIMSARVGADMAETTLWMSDGTPGGAQKLSTAAHYPNSLKSANGLVFFSATTPQFGYELWKTDGTPQGTTLLKDISIGTRGSSPGNFTALSNAVLFQASTINYGLELWTSDGTEAGTHLVKDIAPGTAWSWPQQLTTFNDKVYFVATDETHGFELWKSDGTEANTTMVKDIRGADVTEEVDIVNIVATDQWLIFGALNGAGKPSVWKSDGTQTGTIEILDFDTQADLPVMLAATGSKAFFVRQSATATELWSTDGSNTDKLRTIPNEVYQSISVVKGNSIYFITTSTDLNLEGKNYLWQSDGTVAGTTRIRFDGNPYRLQTSGQYVFLAGNADKEGAELFVIEESNSPSQGRLAFEETGTSEDTELITSFPNPFAGSISLKVSGNSDDHFSLEVFNISGISVHQQELSYNIAHQVGSSEWPAGMYVLRIKTGQKLFVRKMMKLEN
jgi:ELWxxDGT repeat protein